MTTYEFLLFGHLLFVVAWVGTDVGVQVLSLRILASAPERRVHFLGDVEWLGTRLLIPAALLVVLFGVLLVNETGYEFSQTWVTLGFIGFLFSAVTGAAFLGPESGRIAARASEVGAESRRGPEPHPSGAPDLENRAGDPYCGDPRHGDQARPLAASPAGPRRRPPAPAYGRRCYTF